MKVFLSYTLYLLILVSAFQNCSPKSGPIENNEFAPLSPQDTTQTTSETTAQGEAASTPNSASNELQSSIDKVNSPAFQIQTIGATDSAVATFASYNEKVAVTPKGVFVSYIYKSNRKPRQSAYDTLGFWAIKWSQDAGTTFKTIFQGSSHIGTPPIVMADASGANIFLIAVDYAPHLETNHQAQFTFYRLQYNSTKKSYELATKATHVTVGGLTSKNSGVYRIVNGIQLVHFFWKDRVFTLTINGKPYPSKSQFEQKVITKGKATGPQYPLLIKNSSNEVSLAYTAVNTDCETEGAARYFDIRFLRGSGLTSDKQIRWLNPVSASSIVPILPIETDSIVPSIVRNRSCNLSQWLANFHEHQGIYFFVYRETNLTNSNASEVWLVRFDKAKKKFLARKPMKAEGLIFRNNSSVFTSGNKGEIYVTGLATDNRLATLVSKDKGESWQVAAVSEKFEGFQPSYVTGGKETDAQGRIFGIFTEGATSNPAGSQVHAFTIMPDTR